MPRKTLSTDEKAHQFATKIFKAYDRDLHRYLMRRIHKAQRTQDLAQEVYLRLLRVKHTDLVTNPQGYVYKIAAHVVYEYKCALDLEGEVIVTDADVEELMGNPAFLEPDKIIERATTRDKIHKMLQKLPELHRNIITLNKGDGLSYQEVSRELGISPHTMKKYLFQGLAELRKQKWE